MHSQWKETKIQADKINLDISQNLGDSNFKLEDQTVSLILTQIKIKICIYILPNLKRKIKKAKELIMATAVQ